MSQSLGIDLEERAQSPRGGERAPRGGGRRAGGPPPPLRFFAWAPPTVSLGYGQPLAGDVDLAACAALGVGLVRRPTGGSAIYHDGPERELTYSIVATAADLGIGADLLETYPWIGRGLARGL